MSKPFALRLGQLTLRRGDLSVKHNLRAEYDLGSNAAGKGIKVERFDAGGLFEKRNGLGVGWIWDEMSSLISILGDEVARDGTGFCKPS